MRVQISPPRRPTLPPPEGSGQLRRLALARWERMRQDLAEAAVAFHQSAEALHPPAPKAWVGTPDR